MTLKFNFAVCSIEKSHDVDKLTIDELQSSLWVHEQKINQQEKNEQAWKASLENHFTPSRVDSGQDRLGRGNNDCEN